MDKQRKNHYEKMQNELEKEKESVVITQVIHPILPIEDIKVYEKPDFDKLRLKYCLNDKKDFSVSVYDYFPLNAAIKMQREKDQVIIGFIKKPFPK